MAKKTKAPEIEAPQEAAPEPVSDRQARWDAYLAKARPQNPVIFDMQKENGEFDKIPDDFV